MDNRQGNRKVQEEVKKMLISDQPGRIFAILISSPSLFVGGVLLIKSNNIKLRKTIGSILTIMSPIFFFYELFWIMNYPPKMVTFYDQK